MHITHVSQTNPIYHPLALTPLQISASFETFCAYSSGLNSVVLVGKEIPPQRTMNPNPNQDQLNNYFAPTIIPELQGRDVISCVVGDYHYGALTATGKLLTWGAFSKGALGLGDPVEIPAGQPGGYATQEEKNRAFHERWGLRNSPPDVQCPTEVRFVHQERHKRPKYCLSAAAFGRHMGALVIDLDVCLSCPRSYSVHNVLGKPDQEGDDELVAEPPTDQDACREEPRQTDLPLFGRGGRMLPFRMERDRRGIDSEGFSLRQR